MHLEKRNSPAELSSVVKAVKINLLSGDDEMKDCCKRCIAFSRKEFEIDVFVCPVCKSEYTVYSVEE